LHQWHVFTLDPNALDVNLLLKHDCERRAMVKTFHHQTNETTDTQMANLWLDKARSFKDLKYICQE
jgi:hypothetical protein